ncbi:MAG: 50S ribosomal protein L18 [Deltaproteobacteria bacterium]
MKKARASLKARMRRRAHIRKRLKGTGDRPRLSVFRSARHIYAQIIDDSRGVTYVSASTLSPEIASETTPKSSKCERARAVGRLIAQKAKAAGITRVCFDRGGYKYHGRISSLAEGAREGGLEF